jgi:D-sedoheptulose 7-phosphate isomerase
MAAGTADSSEYGLKRRPWTRTIQFMKDDAVIARALADAQQALQALRDDPAALAAIDAFVARAAGTLSAGRRLLACGNGGSMCDAMHFAQEWTGRFRDDRRALPAHAFSDAGLLTNVANDYGYEQVFARIVAGQGQSGDLLVVLSTSGDSPNLLRAAEQARSMDICVVGLLGRGGGKLAPLCDVPIIVPGAETSDRIQEVHIKILHAVIEAVERRLFPDNYSQT